jgi:hypothetical protein
MGLLVISRVALLTLAPLAEPHKRPHLLDEPLRGYYWHSERRSPPFFEITPNIYLDMWARSDSWQYLDIAERGYYLDHDFGTVACFPLYPLVVRCIGRVVGGHYLTVALFVSAVACWASSVLLYRMVLAWRGVAAARLATVGLFSFPSAFFLTTVFPHSLFLALSLSCLRAIGRDRFFIAGMLCALAGATRTEGFVLIPALALAIWQRRRSARSPFADHAGGPRRPLNRPGRQGDDVATGSESLAARRIRLGDLLGLALAPMGLVAYMTYLWVRFGDPLAFLSIHAHFGRALSNPVETLLRPIWDHVFNVRHFLTYLVAGWLIAATWSRASQPVLVFGWLLFLVPLATGKYEAIYRVQLTTFPIYLGLAAARPRWIAYVQIVVFAALQLAMCFWFVAGVRIN